MAGAVYDPNREELFTATSDGPALLSGADGREVELTGPGRAPGAWRRHGVRRSPSER